MIIHEASAWLAKLGRAGSGAAAPAAHMMFLFWQELSLVHLHHY
jgi:hypothetical protein